MRVVFRGFANTTRAAGIQPAALFYCLPPVAPVRNCEERSVMMMGFGSVEIALAFWLSIGSAALCVVYGIVNWNNTGAEAGKTVHEEDA